MSAKKAASTTRGTTTRTTSKSAATSSRKSTANGKATAATSVVAASERTLAPLHIGQVAGEIWGLLASGDSQTLAAIKKSIDAPSDVVLAAVGWLAREDKLEFALSGRTLKISLKA